MTDIYINQRKSRKGCLALSLALLAVVAAAGIYGLQQRRAARPEPVVTEAPEGPTKPAPRKPVPDAEDPGPALLREARMLKQQEQYLRARELCFQILEQTGSESVRKAAEELLGDIHITLALSPRPMPEKTDYTVQSGDTLGGLARRFNTTVELIQRSNNLRGSLIRVGDRMRILQGEFSIEVSKSGNDLVLYLNDRFFKRYPVGTGAYERTPAGTFKITERIPEPTWWSPEGRVIPYGHEDNVLGTHWLSIDLPGYGIHGTWEPETIGHQASAGCVRLLNEDIKELYTLVPVGTKVVIHE